MDKVEENQIPVDPKRPTKYRKEFPQMLVKHMMDGNSYEAFGAIVNVTEETLNAWTKKYPEFDHAKKLGKEYERLFWENVLKRGATGNLAPVMKQIAIYDKNNKLKYKRVMSEPGKFNATAAIFALKNKFPKQWRDSQHIDLTLKDGTENLSDDEIKRLKEHYASILMSKKKNPDG